MKFKRNTKNFSKMFIISYEMYEDENNLKYISNAIERTDVCYESIAVGIMFENSINNCVREFEMIKKDIFPTAKSLSENVDISLYHANEFVEHLLKDDLFIKTRGL